MSHESHEMSMNSIRIINLTGAQRTDRFNLPRASVTVDNATEGVAEIINSVRARGLSAVREATKRFDGVDITALRVPQKDIDLAWEQSPEPLRTAIKESIERVTIGHRAQLPEPKSVSLGEGAQLHQQYFPIRRVGLYAPGGLAAYASSVVMNVVPAQVAGVDSIVVVSPPQADTGLPATPVLAACAALGVKEVYAVGGAQAIAMLAYGLEDDSEGNPIAPVDVITGPGNVFVATAKRLVSADVGIDTIAGPTEILIIADASADPDFVAVDLLSQAEHDPHAACVLVTTSRELAQKVAADVVELASKTPNSERALTALRGEQSMIIVVDDLEQAVSIANHYGAEHLEILTEDPRSLANKIHSAGAIFLGPWSPVSLGDYAAGSNHVLPTSGNSRHASGLSVFAFLRPVQMVDYSQSGLAVMAEHVVTFAEAEGLPAHGEAISARMAKV